MGPHAQRDGVASPREGGASALVGLLDAASHLPVPSAKLILNQSSCQLLGSTGACADSVMVACGCRGCCGRPLTAMQADGGRVMTLGEWAAHARASSRVHGSISGGYEIERGEGQEGQAGHGEGRREGQAPSPLDGVMVQQPGAPYLVPFPQWLRAATGCLGGGALVRRQCSVHWWDTRPEDEDVGAIPARPCQLAAGRSCSETGTAVYGAWRAASILSYDARTCVYTVKYHTDPKRHVSKIHLPLAVVHWARTPPSAGLPPRALPEGVPPLPPILVPPPAPAGHGSSGSAPCSLEQFPDEGNCGALGGQHGWDPIAAAAAAAGVGRQAYLQTVSAGSAEGRRPPSASSSGEVAWWYVPGDEQQQQEQLQAQQLQVRLPMGRRLLPQQSVSTQQLWQQLARVEQEQEQLQEQRAWAWSNGAQVKPPAPLPQRDANPHGELRPELVAVPRSSSGTVFSPVSAQGPTNAPAASYKGPEPAAAPETAFADAGSGGSQRTGYHKAHAADGRWGAQRGQGLNGQVVVLDLSAVRGSGGWAGCSPEAPTSPFTTNTFYTTALLPLNATATAAAAAVAETDCMRKLFPRDPAAGTTTATTAAPLQPPYQKVNAPGAATAAAKLKRTAALPAVNLRQQDNDNAPTTAALAASAVAGAAVPSLSRPSCPRAALFSAPAAADSSIDSICNGLPIQIGGEDVDSDIMQLLWEDLDRHPWPWQAEAATVAGPGVASSSGPASAPFTTDPDGTAAMGSVFRAQQHQAAEARQQQQQQPSAWYLDLGLPPIKRPCLELQLPVTRGSLPATHGTFGPAHMPLGAVQHGTARALLGAGMGLGLGAMGGMGGDRTCMGLAAAVLNGRGAEEGHMDGRVVGADGGSNGAEAPMLVGDRKRRLDDARWVAE